MWRSFYRVIPRRERKSILVCCCWLFTFSVAVSWSVGSDCPQTIAPLFIASLNFLLFLYTDSSACDIVRNSRSTRQVHSYFSLCAENKKQNRLLYRRFRLATAYELGTTNPCEPRTPQKIRYLKYLFTLRCCLVFRSLYALLEFRFVFTQKPFCEYCICNDIRTSTSQCGTLRSFDRFPKLPCAEFYQTHFAVADKVKYIFPFSFSTESFGPSNQGGTSDGFVFPLHASLVLLLTIFESFLCYMVGYSGCVSCFLITASIRPNVPLKKSG